MPRPLDSEGRMRADGGDGRLMTDLPGRSLGQEEGQGVMFSLVCVCVWGPGDWTRGCNCRFLDCPRTVCVLLLPRVPALDGG